MTQKNYHCNVEVYVEIQQVLARYARGVDRLDRNLLLSCYWEDAVDDHGAMAGTATQFVDWVIPMLEKEFSITTHAILQTLVDVQGTRAWAETYWQVACTPRLGGAILLSYGRYLDIFEKRGAEWRIAVRELVFDWEQLMEPRPWRSWPSPEVRERRAGRVDSQDLSYRFREKHGFGK